MPEALSEALVKLCWREEFNNYIYIYIYIYIYMYLYI